MRARHMHSVLVSIILVYQWCVKAIIDQSNMNKLNKL